MNHLPPNLAFGSENNCFRYTMVIMVCGYDSLAHAYVRSRQTVPAPGMVTAGAGMVWMRRQATIEDI